MGEQEFKTRQEVLVRADKDCEWRYGLYSHFNKASRLHCVGSAHWRYCIPFIGNEELVGTTDEPKEDLPINTPVMCSDSPIGSWIFSYYAGNNTVFDSQAKSNKTDLIYGWKYIIPVDKFDFNNPENSIKDTKNNYGTNHN